ncbi:MAG: DNA mismatch repair endonuclease MutL [Oscillospiraceae bacterium]|nr:DNA mismatch repair endonuclease MutL [Oscillospiraceae bacterium]
MPKIIQLSPHVANLIAAGEVVERPASVMKELLENAVDAGATAVTAEIRDGGMTFLRVTDNGCGMLPEDAKTAFLRHATSKLRVAEDLAAIQTMGFRGEALAAIASVSRIDLMTKPTGSISGTSLSLEAGIITEESEAGCPEGTTIIIRDLFFNTPARMKFMKSDVVEGSRVTAAVQLQAIAHPEVAFRFLRDGKEVLSTPGTGKLRDAVYCVYGKDSAKMAEVESSWEGYRLTGYVSRPTDSRPSRNMQTFFVNGRPVKSRMMIAALEEAYRNRIMAGKFPACVLQLSLPANAVDVNVHPAKTEVKFLNEKAVFDCIHYGVLGALNKTPDRPNVQFKEAPAAPSVPPSPPVPPTPPVPPAPKQQSFFRTMTAAEYQAFSGAVKSAPQPSPLAAAAVAAAVERTSNMPVKEQVILPQITPPPAPEPEPIPIPVIPVPAQEPEQESLSMPEVAPWRYVGELYRSYVIVEQGEDAFIIDKHAAHERILFDKLKANQEAITGQTLLTPIPCRLDPASCGALLANQALLEELGFEIDTLGENTIVLRAIPMDLAEEDAADAVEALAADLLVGRREDKSTVRDEVLHTVACKAAIKAGWVTDEKELLALIGQVMARDDLKYCPHGRPICITLSKKQLEKQFKRT